MKSHLTEELKTKFHDLLVTSGGIVIDDAFKSDLGNQGILEKDPELFHRQELKENAESYEEREELLESTLADLQLHSINFQEVYNILVWAKRQQQNYVREQRGIDARRQFIEGRARCLEAYVEAAKALKAFIETSPYPTRLSVPRESRVIDLLRVIEAAIKDDAVLNYVPRNESGDPLPTRSSRAGRRVKPWLAKDRIPNVGVRRRLQNIGVHSDYCEQLLKAVGLVSLVKR